MPSLTTHQVTSCLLEVVDELPAGHGIPIDEATDYLMSCGYHPNFFYGSLNTLVDANLATVRSGKIFPNRS